MMDCEVRKSGLAGNYCAIILELAGSPDASKIEQRCHQFSQSFPQATARLKQTGRQFEWQISHADQGSLPFYQHDENPEAIKTGFSTLISSILNKSTSPTETVPVELHLIRQKNTSQLVLRWFHPVCDAKGAELILYHLFSDEPLENLHDDSPITELLNKWSLWEKFKLGLKSKKNIQQLDKYASIVPKTLNSPADQVHTRHMLIDAQNSAQIFKNARHYMGMSGIALYFIGCMIRALTQTGNLTSGDAFCVPYAVNLRKRKAQFPVFGNQVSFLFAQTPKSLVDSRQSLFAHLREQNKMAIKHSLDRSMLPLMQAGSWLSQEKYGSIVRLSPSGNERSSFWFSYTGNMDPMPDAIEQCAITQMYQFSQVTSPPALGLLVNNFKDQIILSYNYVNSQFDSKWLDRLLLNMKHELLESE